MTKSLLQRSDFCWDNTRVYCKITSWQPSEIFSALSLIEIIMNHCNQTSRVWCVLSRIHKLCVKYYSKTNNYSYAVLRNLTVVINLSYLCHSIAPHKMCKLISISVRAKLNCVLFNWELKIFGVVLAVIRSVKYYEVRN